MPGGLGFTYPNPIQQRGKLWLFWRGGGWNPTFSYTRDGRTWVPARELLRSNDPERPYAKYVGDGDRSIHGIFTEGHANSFHNSLYYLRYENSGLSGPAGGGSGGCARCRCRSPSSTGSTASPTPRAAPGRTTSR